MPDDFGDRLRKELEEFFREKGAVEPAPCAYHRMVPPPGCIMGWDMSDCNYCSFYKPVEIPDKREDKRGV